MIILHNRYSRASREFVSTHARRRDTVVDWYAGGREAWATAGETMDVSAFPSVIIDVPSYIVKAAGGEREVLQEARCEVVRMPSDRQEVYRFQEAINMDIAAKTESPSPALIDLDGPRPKRPQNRR